MGANNNMELKQYKLKGTVTAVQVTQHNILEVAKWAEGIADHNSVRSFSYEDHQYCAIVGKWLVRNEYGRMEVLTDEQFKEIFKEKKN